MGDGEAGKSLTPSPALLAYLIQRPFAADEYLLWSISEGGKPFGTGMPAFKDTLKRDQIWKIIAFMRGGFPDAKSAKSHWRGTPTMSTAYPLALLCMDAVRSGVHKRCSTRRRRCLSRGSNSGHL